jgi:hypothetical protein
MFRDGESGFYEHCIPGDYNPARSDSDVFRHREDSTRSAYRADHSRSRRGTVEVLSLLAACEFAGALGIVLGIWWPYLGMAAGIGIVVYFVGAVVAHLRVGDVKGIGPSAFLLVVAAAALALRILTYGAHSAG